MTATQDTCGLLGLETRQDMQERMDNTQPTWNGPDARRDFESASIVELGITLQQLVSTRRAASYLNENNISLSVALRVLSQPSKRRAQQRV